MHSTTIISAITLVPLSLERY